MASQLGTRAPLAQHSSTAVACRYVCLPRSAAFRSLQQQQQQRTAQRTAAVKETDISTKDWRAQKMSDTVKMFFERVWTRGEVELLDSILTDDFVWQDTIWMPNRPVVGPKAFSSFVQQMRMAYPDLAYEVGQVGVADPQHVFVHWTCHGTNLHPMPDNAGRPHKPTFHESHISGIDLVTFCEDRSRFKEVVIYRQPTLEEREFLEEEALEQDRLSIKLERLHFDGRS